MWILPITVAAGLVVGYALAWTYDLLARKAFEATLTEAEREQFDEYRRLLPWRNFADVVELDRVAIKSALDGLSSLSQQLQTLREKLRTDRATQASSNLPRPAPSVRTLLTSRRAAQ
jgi:hypothetical protein